MSQLAVVKACQIPFKSGWPSVVRGALYTGRKLTTGRGRRSLARHRNGGEPEAQDRRNRHPCNHYVSRANAHR